MTERHVNDAEFGELLAGTAPAEVRAHLVDCGACSAGFAGLAAVRDALRNDLQRAAERPGSFWSRQRARLRDRLRERHGSLRWALAGMAALATLSFALLTAKPPQPSTSARTSSVDADDLLLKDIQHSLAHQAPETLMPASVLVQEITIHSTDDRMKEN